MGWKETKDALRRALEREGDEWDRVRAGHDALAPIATPLELTHRLVDARGADWSERRAIAQALLTAYHQAPSRFLSTALLVAYWPLLGGLCARAFTIPDREQVALTSFVVALAQSDPARGTESLAWRVRRQFFRTLRAATPLNHLQLDDTTDPSASVEDVVTLCDALRTIEQRSGVPLFASLSDEPLSHLMARAQPEVSPLTRERALFALYKRRARVLTGMRRELQKLSA